MKKTLAALLTLLLTLTMLCLPAQASTYHCTYITANDDEDIAGDETAEVEAIYGNSVVVIDTDQGSIVITSGKTTITQDTIFHSEEKDDMFYMLCESGNLYAVTFIEGNAILMTKVGQTFLYYSMEKD